MKCSSLQYKNRLEREKFLQELQKRIVNCPVSRLFTSIHLDSKTLKEYTLVNSRRVRAGNMGTIEAHGYCAGLRV